jgi:hypothetical protein
MTSAPDAGQNKRLNDARVMAGHDRTVHAFVQSRGACRYWRYTPDPLIART